MREPSSEPFYRAAIIGVGRIGNSYDDAVIERQPATYYQGENRHAGLYVILPVNHAEAYQTTPGFQLVAAANRGQETLAAFGERRGVKALYPDFRQMLRQEQPDVVSVCTQSPEKAEITIAAAEAGVKAIIVEKALATSMAEADAMLAACERNGVLLAVNHPNRFSPLVRKSKELIAAGALGELTSVTIHAGGGMLHIGTHMFDLMRYWAGNAVELYAQVPPTTHRNKICLRWAWCALPMVWSVSLIIPTVTNRQWKYAAKRAILRFPVWSVMAGSTNSSQRCRLRSNGNIPIV